MLKKRNKPMLKQLVSKLYTVSLYKMKYWQGIYLGGLADFSATANIKSAINLPPEYDDIIGHVDQKDVR